MTDEDEWTHEDSKRLAREIRPILVQVALLDREELVRAKRELEKYEAAGPLVDPTGYMQKREANQRAKDRLGALIEFYDALDVRDLAEQGEATPLPDDLPDAEGATLEKDG